MENKRKLSVDYLNIVFKFETDVFKEGGTIRYRFAEFLGLDLDDLDGAGGVYGYEASRRGNGVLVAWREGETVLYSFSGSACANFGFSEKENLKRILEYVQVFGWVSRIDIALDVADNTLFELDYFIKKLEALEFTSKKRRFNVISEKDGAGHLVGQTVYLGNSRADAGSKGNIYLRAYRKDLELKNKGAKTPTWAQGSESIERFEISIGGKKKTEAVVSEILADDGSIEQVHSRLLANLITFRIADSSDGNKSRWDIDERWLAFLQGAEALQISEAQTKTIFSMLDWMNKSVLPSLAFMSELSKEKKIDFFRILKEAVEEKGGDLSARQEKMKKELKDVKSDNFRSLLKSHLSHLEG